jgi:hypothetical protein
LRIALATSHVLKAAFRHISPLLYAIIARCITPPFPALYLPPPPPDMFWNAQSTLQNETIFLEWFNFFQFSLVFYMQLWLAEYKYTVCSSVRCAFNWKTDIVY